MAHGLIHGVKRPVVHGVKHNGASLYGGVAWSVDAASGKAVPATSAEWSAFKSANGLSIGTPDSLWLFQEASGNPADTFGVIPLTAAGSVLYRQSVSGWTRNGVGFTDGVAAQFSSSSVSLPSGTSQTILCLATVPAAPAANRELYVGPNAILRLNSTPRVVAVAGGGTAIGTADYTGGVRPYAYRINTTALSNTVMTNQEKLVPAYAAPVGRMLRFGSASVAAAGTIVWACAWYNDNAKISDANMKALLVAMGYSIPW